MSTASVICVACLRCRHRGVLDSALLAVYGLPAGVTMAELSRRLVCEACGARAITLQRRPADEADAFMAG